MMFMFIVYRKVDGKANPPPGWWAREGKRAGSRVVSPSGYNTEHKRSTPEFHGGYPD
jgi:hypothetical protein